MFKIALHQDDADVLLYIQRRLAIGNVRHYKNECIFNVTDRKGVELLISISDKYNLNTTKYLNYKAFRQAYDMYINRESRFVGEELKEKIIILKDQMNKKRVNFYLTEDHSIDISRY